MRHTTSPLALTALAMLFTLPACSTGPNYVRPQSTTPKADARGTFLRADSGMTQDAPTAQWWKALGDPTLDGLIAQALAHAPDMQAMQARVAQARAGLATSRTSLLPRIGTSVAAPYVSLPAGALGINDAARIDTTSYSLGFDASWEADIFGANSRKVESTRATAKAAEAAVANARVTLTSEVARAYIALRLRQAMATIQEDQAGIDRTLVALAQQRFAAGAIGETPVAQARIQLLRTESDLARSRAEATVLVDQIAVLTGGEPGTLDATLLAPSPIPLPPARVSVGDPATLLRNRPDIQGAEHQLEAATANIGARMAERFPKISFVGLLGLGGPHIGDVFDPASVIGLGLPQIRWSLFDGGRITAEVHHAEAARDEAEANYRRTILTALQDAENALTRFGMQRTAYASAVSAREQITHAVQLQEQRAAGGTGSRVESMTARRQALDTALAAASARADLTISFIAVEKALGLGWEAADTGR